MKYNIRWLVMVPVFDCLASVRIAGPKTLSYQYRAVFYNKWLIYFRKMKFPPCCLTVQK